jgi:hypothetical protein
MQAYVSSALDNWAMVKVFGEALARQGVSLSYDWATRYQRVVDGEAESSGVEEAIAEELGVLRAAVFVLLCPAGRGAHVEFGIARGAGVPCVVYCPRNVQLLLFHQLPGVMVCREWDAAIEAAVGYARQARLPGGDEPLRVVFDLDGVLAGPPVVPGDYSTCPPYPHAVAEVRAAVQAGCRVVIATARYMRRAGGNLLEATARGRDEAALWLSRHRIPYHELHFGKPSGALYVDDRGVRVESGRGEHDWVEHFRPRLRELIRRRARGEEF